MTDRETTEYTDEEVGVRMTVIERPSVREQLSYRSLMAFGEQADTYARFWQAVRPLIVEWECDALPDKDTDLSDVYGKGAADAVIWACSTVSAHLSRVEDVEKN